jgi:hypothetical protein
MGGCRDFCIDRIVALARRRGHDQNVNVNAHAVEVGQTALYGDHDLSNVVCLLRIDVLAGCIRKMGNRYLAGVEMGLRQRRGLGNNYMSVNVDRRENGR